VIPLEKNYQGRKENMKHGEKKEGQEKGDGAEPGLKNQEKRV